jgi:hypothetical protein
MSNFLKKNSLWIFIILILIIGGFYAINNAEGMALERLCYNRESDGAKICVKGDSSCTYFPDGTSKCTQGKKDCNQYTNCADCTDKNNKPLGGRCYWNSSKNICGSRLEKGFTPFCRNQTQTQMQNNGSMGQTYLPVVTLLPTSTLANGAASLNSYLL